MKISIQRPAHAAILGLAVLASNSCETTGNSAASYDAGGFQDPWYYGSYYDDPDYIVVPPGDRPDRPVTPTHPIARPPMTGPRPMPTTMPRGGGGRGGGGRR